MNNPTISANRVLSIDAFRGIIIFTMVFVNELAGIADIPQWWGILGLIGWAYLIAGTLFLITRQFASPAVQFFTLALAALALVGLFFALDKTALASVPVLQTLAEANGNHTHAAMVLAGVILSQLFYFPIFAASKFKNYLVFTGVVVLLAFASWQVSPISKTWATPSWALFSVFFCCVIFGAVYWLVDVKQQRAWTAFFEPSATNPLLVYILPYIVLSLCGILGFYLRPEFFNAGLAGILWSLGFACVIMGIGAGLTRMGLRVKL